MASRIEALEAANILNGMEAVLILTHERPDGDAFGSAVGLARILRANGRQADAFIPDPLPDKFLKLAGRDHLTRLTKAELARYRNIVVVDSARDGRTGVGPELSFADLAALPILNLDHHVDNEVSATWSCVEGAAAASAQLVLKIARLIPGWKIPADAALLLMLGIVTDTGSFRFVNTTAETFRAAAELLELGADLEKITNAAFFSKPLKQQQFELEMLQSCVYSACDYRYLYAVVPQELFEKYDFDMRDGEAIIDLLREVADVVIVALVYQQGPNCKISLRSKDSRYPVGPIARNLGGGGHQMAAGVTLADCEPAAAAAKLLAEVTAMLEK